MTYDLNFISVNDPAAAAAADESTLPAKLICRLPLEARTVTIPFEMHDLPLEQ